MLRKIINSILVVLITASMVWAVAPKYKIGQESDMASPPNIGVTTPGTGRFDTLKVTGASLSTSAGTGFYSLGTASFLGDITITSNATTRANGPFIISGAFNYTGATQGTAENIVIGTNAPNVGKFTDLTATNFIVTSAGFVGVSVASLTASNTVTFKGTIHDSLGGGGTVGKVLTMGSDNLTPYWATAAGGGLASGKATSVQTAKTITSTDPADAANDLATVTITPTSASNNVLVVATGTINVTATDRACAFSLVRNATMISQMTHGAYAQFETAYANAATNIKLDSPATTSAITYRVRGYINAAGGSCIYMTNSTNNVTIYVEEKSP